MFLTPEFWVLIAFLLLFIFGGKKIYVPLKEALDNYRQKIAQRIQDVEQLHDEALSLLNSYKKKHQEAMEQAAKIIAYAEKEASEFKKLSEQEFEKFMSQKEKAILERIAIEAEEAKAKLRKEAADEALSIVENILSKETKEKEKLTEASLQEIPSLDLKSPL